jgi:hypothetical protein
MICSAWYVAGPICEIASDGGFVVTAGAVPCPLSVAWVASVGGGGWGRDEFRSYVPLRDRQLVGGALSRLSPSSSLDR